MENSHIPLDTRIVSFNVTDHPFFPFWPEILQNPEKSSKFPIVMQGIGLLSFLFNNLPVSKKESIRKNIEQLKEESNLILQRKELSPEVKFFIKSMLSLMDIIVTVLLEKTIRKNSSNSGLPPSQDFGSNGNRNKKSDKKDDKKRGSQLDNSRIEKNTQILSPHKCSGCGVNLKDAKVIDTEERKLIDIEYVIKETTFTAEIKECKKCQKSTKAKFPQGVNGPEQYGTGIKAAIINFLMVQMMSLQRVKEHFKGLIGRYISSSVMLKYIGGLGDSLEEWEKQKKQKILESKYFHVDETSMRVEKNNWWIHVYSAGDIVLLFLHPKRGVEAIESIGILPKYKGIIVHDCLSSYFNYKEVSHALCAAHLLRELKLVEESTVDRWATRLKILLKVAIHMVGKSKEGILSKKQYTKLQRLYREILEYGIKQLPAFPESTGKKGRPKHTDAQNLWLRLKKHEGSVLMFAKVAEVDPTNNRAERDLRMSKVKKKVSGCFRSPAYAAHFCRISSYVKTMRNKGYSSLQAITMALKGEIPE